jgi:heat shock protein 4
MKSLSNLKESAKAQVILRIDHNGLITYSSAEMQENVEVEEPIPPEEKPKEESSSSGEKKKEASEQPPTETPKTEAPKTRTKIKTNRTDIQLEEKNSGLPNSILQKSFEEEAQMRSQDRLAIDTAEAKNAVESYVLGIRSKVNGDLFDYSTSDERDAISSLSYKIEDWLYEDGADQTKGVYVQKLDEIKKLGEPIAHRKTEENNRIITSEELFKTLNNYRNSVKDAKYEHIDKEELNKIVNECDKIQNEVSPLLEKQKTLAKSASPAILSSELINKRKDLEKMANQILSKPKPAPPKEEKKEAPKQQAENECEMKDETKKAQEDSKKKESTVDSQGDVAMNSEID